MGLSGRKNERANERKNEIPRGETMKWENKDGNNGASND